jgi:hypothetical protein
MIDLVRLVLYKFWESLHVLVDPSLCDLLSSLFQLLSHIFEKFLVIGDFVKPYNEAVVGHLWSLLQFFKDFWLHLELRFFLSAVASSHNSFCGDLIMN